MMILSVSTTCKYCKRLTDSIYVIGGKAYCPDCIEKFRRGAMGAEKDPSRILIIIDLYPPSHVGETTDGYALVKKNDRWFFAIDQFYAKPGSTTEERSFFYKLPDDFFIGMTFDKLAVALSNVVKRSTGYIDCSYYLETLISRRANDVGMISDLFQ